MTLCHCIYSDEDRDANITLFSSKLRICTCMVLPSGLKSWHCFLLVTNILLVSRCEVSAKCPKCSCKCNKSRGIMNFLISHNHAQSRECRWGVCCWLSLVECCFSWNPGWKSLWPSPYFLCPQRVAVHWGAWLCAPHTHTHTHMQSLLTTLVLNTLNCAFWM